MSCSERSDRWAGNGPPFKRGMPENDDIWVTGGGESRRGGQNLDPSAPLPAETILYESSVFVRRLVRLSSRCEIVCDTLPEDGIETRFLRWTPEVRDASASFTFATNSSGFVSDERMGTLLTGGADGETPLLWLPRGIVAGRKDRHGRLKVVGDVEVESWWELDDGPKFNLRLSTPGDVTVYLPMVAFTEGTSMLRTDLFHLSDIELRRFLKSDWFDASSPVDLWKYFVDAGIFDPRDAGRGRFRCQQCAFAWWSYLMALHNETGKRHYRSLASAVAWSVRVDLGSDGSWRHGFWHEEPEIHARFFWDGVRLLLAEHSLCPDATLLDAARSAGSFALENLSAPLADNHLWFLHDSVERSRPLRVQTALLGRSQRNSLCLNTHVQALCALGQLSRIVVDGELFEEAYDRGMAGLEALLAVRGGSGRGGVLDRMLPAALAWKVPHGFVERVLRFLMYRVFPPLFWWMRKDIQGLMFPSGYLDRDLGATMLADEYHVINLKDLFELHHSDPRPWLRVTIEDAAAFIGSLDYQRALERSPIWAEWLDVLAAWNVEQTGLSVDRGEVEGAVWEMLGAHSLDAFCHRVGVWPLAGEDRAGEAR
jgi:hypothetical protein